MPLRGQGLGGWKAPRVVLCPLTSLFLSFGSACAVCRADSVTTTTTHMTDHTSLWWWWWVGVGAWVGGGGSARHSAHDGGWRLRSFLLRPPTCRP